MLLVLLVLHPPRVQPLLILCLVDFFPWSAFLMQLASLSCSSAPVTRIISRAGLSPRSNFISATGTLARSSTYCCGSPKVSLLYFTLASMICCLSSLLTGRPSVISIPSNHAPQIILHFRLLCVRIHHDMVTIFCLRRLLLMLFPFSTLSIWFALLPVLMSSSSTNFMVDE